VSGTEAGQLGLATRVTAQPLEDALALARDIAGKSPDAVQGAKSLLNLAGEAPLSDGLAAEQRVIRALIASANQIEAVTAFFEKRDPVFTDPT
jgi:enoyl-CoA hydratase/carnithine racemase